MDDQRVSEIIDKSVAAALLARGKEEGRCNLNIDKEKHGEEHAFLRNIMELADRIENVKWGVLSSTAKTFTRILLLAVIVGLFFIAKHYKGSLP